jgi:hypothetical protein
LSRFFLPSCTLSSHLFDSSIQFHHLSSEGGFCFLIRLSTISPFAFFSLPSHFHRQGCGIIQSGTSVESRQTIGNALGMMHVFSPANHIPFCSTFSSTICWI